MDNQYVDMYLRKKKGAPLDSTVIEPHSTIERHVDRIVRGSYNVQQFVDRTDVLSQQVDTFDDKILNLTKLVKLSQSLQDEKESDLRKQNHELKARLKRQEHVSAKLGEDMEALKAQMQSAIRDAVLTATTPILQDISSITKALQETHTMFDRRLAEAKSDVKETLTTQFESMMHHRISLLQETSIERVSQSVARHDFAFDSIEKKLDQLDSVRLVELRRSVDERIVSSCQMARDAVTSEMKAIVKTHHENYREDITQQVQILEQTNGRVAQLERQSVTIDAALTEFIATFKDSTKVHSAKTDDIASSVQEFMALHEQTRNVVATELEGTKQWATRNLHRLKKHIDVINADLAAFRDSHVELSSQMQKVKCHAEAEHDKLTILLQQKSREANLLTEIVDKEIQSIHQITQQHRGLAAGNPAQSSLYEELAFGAAERGGH